ncbi:MAG: CZB domain-containing protein [Pseudomonadota bacterium]
MGAFFLLRMNDHVQYLNRIKATLEGRGDFQGSDHHSCKLGKWLDTDGPAEAAGLGPEAQAAFAALIEPHQRFHEASNQALGLRAAGDTAGCEAQVTEMHRLSATLVGTLLKMDGLAAGKK